MSQDQIPDRLERLRSNLAALRERSAAADGFAAGATPRSAASRRGPAASSASRTEPSAAAAGQETPGPMTPSELTGEGHDPAVTAELPAAPARELAAPAPAATAPARRAAAAAETTGRAASTPRPTTAVRPAATQGPGEAGRRRSRRNPLRRRPRRPRPPRRNPFRSRALPPPRRLAVPTPIPVRRRSTFLAAPRWPQWTLLGGVLTAVVLLPACAGMAYRLYQAMAETSFLFGATPSPSDYLRASAGVAGGAMTLAPALVALGLARGRIAYLWGTVVVLAIFGVFPSFVYSANAGVSAVQWPSFDEMLMPDGWGQERFLRLAFALGVSGLAVAIVDLVYRSARALQVGYQATRK